jgi:hypothetical protein
MLISLVSIDNTSERSKFVLNVEVNGERLRFNTEVEDDLGIHSASFSPELFELLTEFATQKASQTLIRAILAWEGGANIDLPMILSE